MRRSSLGLTAVTFSHETLDRVAYIHPLSADWFEGRHVRVHPLTDGNVRIDKFPTAVRSTPDGRPGRRAAMPAALDKDLAALSLQTFLERAACRLTRR